MKKTDDLKAHGLTIKMFSAMGSYNESAQCILVGKTNTMQALVRRGYAEKLGNGLYRLTDEGKRVHQEIERARRERYEKRVDRDRRERGMQPRVAS